MTDLSEHLLWLHDRCGRRLSDALREREGVELTPDEAIEVFAQADPTSGLKLTDWLVRTYVEHATFRLEDVRAGKDSTVGQTLALWVNRRGRLPRAMRDINLYESPGSLWRAAGGDVEAMEATCTSSRALRRAERKRAREESLIIIEDDRGTVAVPLTEFAACWWGRGTRWCTAADKNNAFASYDRRAPLFVLVLPDGSKAQFHAHQDTVAFMDAADNRIDRAAYPRWKELLFPVADRALGWSLKALQFASDDMRADRGTVLNAVGQDGLALRHASDDLRADRQIVLVAVTRNGYALEHASADLRADQATVLTAIRKNTSALQYASQKLRGNRKIVLDAVTRNGYALEHASADLRNDRKIVTAAVSRDGLALMHASMNLRANIGIVLAALATNGHALEFATSDLRGDRKTVLAAVSQFGYALHHASSIMKADRAVVLAAVSQDGYALRYASGSLRADREIVLAAVSNDGYALRYASNDLQEDRNIVLAAVAQTGHALQHVIVTLRADRDIVLTAVSQSGHSLQYASDDLKSDREIVLTAMTESKHAINYASTKLHAEILMEQGHIDYALRADPSEEQDSSPMHPLEIEKASLLEIAETGASERSWDPEELTESFRTHACACLPRGP